MTARHWRRLSGRLQPTTPRRPNAIPSRISDFTTAVTRVAQPAPATPSDGRGPTPTTREYAIAELATTVTMVAIIGLVGRPADRSTPERMALVITGRVASTVRRK